MSDPLNLFTDSKDDPLGLFDEKNSLLRDLGGLGEAGLTMVTGGLGSIVGGVVGAGDAAIRGNDKGVDTLKSVSNALTYKPRLSEGQEFTERLGNAFDKFKQHSRIGFEALMHDIPFVHQMLEKGQITQEQYDAIVDASNEVGSNFIPVEMLGSLKRGQVHPTPDTAKKIATDRVEPSLPPENTSMSPAMKDAESANIQLQVEKLREELAAKEPDLRARQLAEQQRLYEQAQAERFGIESDARRLEDQQTGQGDLFAQDAGNMQEALTNAGKESEQLQARNGVEATKADLAAMEQRLREAQLAEQQRLHEQAIAEQRGILSDASRLDDRLSGQMDLLSHDVNDINYKLSLVDEHPIESGVRHLDRDKGTVVQGMDESVPTIDFPLKTEVIDRDPAINLMREQIAAQDAQIAHLRERNAMPTAIRSLEISRDNMVKKFQKYMDQNYGVTKAADAYPKLVETGNGTKLPIKQTYNAGKFKRQGGAIDPRVFREGLQIAGNRLADIFSSAAKAQKKLPEPEVTNPVMKALKDSAAGKGVADFGNILKTPEEVIDIAKQASDITRAPIQEHLENGGVFRGLATRNPVVKYTTERIDHAIQAAHRWIRDNLTDTENGLKSYMRALDPTAKGEIWSAMMLHEGQHVLTREELAARGFSEKQIKFYEKFREIDDAFYNEFNKQREKMGLAPIDQRTAHIAGRFTGDFYQMAYRAKLDEHGNPIIDEAGNVVKEVIGRIPGNTKWGVNKASDFIKAQHPDWEIGPIEYKPIDKGASSGDRFRGFMEVLNIIGRDNPHTKQLVDTYKEFVKTDSQNYLNALRHAKDKKAQAGGIIGSEGNKAWKTDVENAQEGMKAQLAYLEQGYQWLEMQKAAKDISTVLGDETVATKLPNAVAWSNQHLDHAMGRNMGVISDMSNAVLSTLGKYSGFGHGSILKVSNNVKHLMMQKFMGFLNIPFTIAQLAQPLQTVPPMALLMKARGIEHSLLQAASDGTWTTMKLFYANTPLIDKVDASFSAFETAALKYAHEAGVFDVQMMDHTRDINASPVKEAFNSLAEANIKYPEMVTRSTAFMTFAHAMKETGMPLDQIFATADNMTKVTMGDYTMSARPKMYDKLGWIGDLASTLARYKHSQVNQITLYGREFKEGVKRGEGLKFAPPLLAHLGTSVAFGGILGLVGYNLADEIYRNFSEYVLKKPDSLTDHLMRTPDALKVVSHGVFSYAGIDMSSRFSNAQAVPESVGEFLIPYGSGIVDTLSGAWEFAKNPNEWNGKRAITALAPSSMTGLLENKFFTEHRDKDVNPFINRRTGENNYNRTDKEVALRNFGFRSMNESTERSINYEFKQKEQAEQRIRGRIMDSAWSDYLSGKLTPAAAGEYARKYTEAGSDQFERDFKQHLEAHALTERQRIVQRNSGSNYSAARNLQDLFGK